MARFSPKQICMAWINHCLEPEKVSPDRETMEELCGCPIPDKLYEEAVTAIQEELSKLKPRFQDYTTKYFKKVESKEVVKDETGQDESA